MADMVKISKFLSLVLRHQPDKIDLHLNAQGWAKVEELLAKAAMHGMVISLEQLQQVVRDNDKQRFALSEDLTQIRANQGHSMAVDLALMPVMPPEVLYHGTASRFLDSIRKQGLLAGDRQHVHLSANQDTAVKVGQRHGKPVVLKVASGAMNTDGHVFYQSENGVWLTAHVPVQYLHFDEHEG